MRNGTTQKNQNQWEQTKKKRGINPAFFLINNFINYKNGANMALTGLVDNTRYLRTDKPQVIQGVNYGNGKLVINGRYDYQPLHGLNWDDESTQVCNTNFAANYARKQYTATTGTINLTENRFYMVSISSDTTFVLPVPKNKNINNEIMVTIYYTSGTVNFGLDTFFDGEVPILAVGNYNLYYDFDPLQDKWVAGVLTV